MGATITRAKSRVTGLVVLIEEAENGLDCNCECFECGDRLVAEQGKSGKRAWNFKHHKNSDTTCSGGQETALHQLAKEMILSNTSIQIPDERLSYSEPIAEKPLGTFIPDVTVYSNYGAVHFEVVVKHWETDEKIQFYKLGKHKSVRIDLSQVSYSFSRAEIMTLVIDEVKNKFKIYWSDDLEQSGKKEPKSNEGLSDNKGCLLVFAFLFLLVASLFKR
jgi:hypothetical protein